MAVSIPISADPSPLINATQRAEVYVNRLRQRLAEVGKIKLTDGVDELRRDAETVGKNLHDLLDPRRSALGGRVRAAGLQDAPIEAIEQQWNRIHPNATPKERGRMLQRFQRNLLAGTSYEATAGSEEHASSQPPPSAPAQSPSRPTAIPGLATLKAGGTFALGLAGVQTGMEAVTDAYKGAHEWSRTTDEFMRRTQDTGEDFAYLKAQIGSLGKAIGMTSDESARLTLAFTRAAQAKDLEQATAGTRTAIGLAAGFGADRDQTVQQMARMQLIGASGPLSTNQKTFALEIARVVGQHNVPLEKGLADFARLAEASAGRTGNAPPTETITGYLQALYDVAEKRPGLKGQSGMALLTQADEGLRTTEDPATLMMLYHGMARLMGTTNFMDVLVQQQRGGLAPIMRKQRDASGKEVEVDTGKTTFDVLVEETGRMYGADPRLHARAVGERIGDPHSIERIMAMIEISRQRQHQGKGGIGAYLQDLKQRGVDPEKLDDTAYKDLGDILKHTDAGQQFQAATAKYDKGYTPTLPFSDEETKRLHELRAKATSGGADAQKEFTDFFVRMIGEHGGQQTPYTQMEVTLGQIRQTLLEKVGQPIETGFAEVAALLQKGFGITPEQAAATENYAKTQKTARTTAQDANDALAAAQGAVDQAPPGSPEHLKALGNLQKVYQQQQLRVQQAQQEKEQAWRKQAGPVNRAVSDWLDPIQSNGQRLSENARSSGVPNPLGWLRNTLLHDSPSPTEAKAAGQLQQPSPRDQEIARLQGELDRLNLNPLDRGWWSSTAEQREQRAQERKEREPELRQQLAALQATEFAPPAETNPLIRPLVEPERRAQGGPIGGGYGGGDRIPALLEAGEFVVNKVASQNHRGLLEQINRGAGAPVRRAQGGPTDSTVWFPPPPAAGVPSLDPPSDGGAADAVQDLQKRLDQLFDPVTRYLGEMAAALRALTGAGTAPTGKAAPPSGTGVTTTGATPASGTTAPLTGTAAPTGAAGLPLNGRPNPRLPGDGLGFLSPGAPWFSPERRPDFVGPPATLAGDVAPQRPQRAGAPGAAGPSATALPPGASALPTTAEGLRFKNRAENTGGGKTHAATYALAHHLQAQYPEFDRITGMDDRYHRSEAYKAKKRAQGLSPNSVHTTGRALDFTINDPKKSAEVAQRLRNELKQAGVNASVIDEYSRKTAGGTGKHIHVNFASDQDAQKYLAASSVNQKPVAQADSTGANRGSSGPIPKDQWAKKGAELAQYYKERLGLTDYQAAALAGNAIHESSLNTKAAGDHGSAHGLFQWRNDRWQRLQEYAQKTGRSSDDWNVQKEFAAIELETSESKALKKLKQTQSLEDASRAINQQYERSADQVGGGADMNRIRESKGVFAEINKPTPTASTPTTPAAAAYTPRPGAWVEPYQSRRDLPPLDAPHRAEDPRAAPPAAGMGMGQLEVLIRQQDAYGARIGQDVAHVLDLRTPRPYGAVSVDRINSARTA